MFPENRELHGVSQPGHHPFIVTISEELMVKASGVLGLPDPEKFISKGSVISCDKSNIEEVRCFLDSLCCEMESSQGQLTNTLINDAVKWHLASLLLSGRAKASAVKSKKRKVGNRRKIIDLTLDYVD